MTNKDNLKEKIRENVKASIAVSNFKKEIRMKKKRFIYSILSSCALLVICIGIMKNVNVVHRYEEHKISDTTIISDDVEILRKEYNVDEADIISKDKMDARYIMDITDNSKIKEDADVIIIGEIVSIDGVVNYNPSSNIYTIPRTVGTIITKKVLKGELDSSKIKFIKGGGIISVEGYMQSFPEINMNGLSEDDKKNKYIEVYYDNDIRPEVNKEYLMYLKYSSDYDRYSICYLRYGLREVMLDKSNDEMNYNIENVKVKNNETGEWQNLSEII